MGTISIAQRNPQSGRTETPLREHGYYVLGDPAHGKNKHKAKFAVRVRTVEEVLDHLRRGFSVRMSDGITRPSLISPRSLDVRVDEVEA